MGLIDMIVERSRSPNTACLSLGHVVVAKKSEKELFLDRVKKTDSCWLWTGKQSNSSGGYGIYKGTTAHRYSYLIHVGIPPKDKMICHRCNNPPCVNPKHLYAGTYKENMRDRDLCGRTARGSRNGQAKLREDKVIVLRSCYKLGGLTHRELGRLFGISKSQVGKCISGFKWAHLERREK